MTLADRESRDYEDYLKNKFSDVASKLKEGLKLGGSSLQLTIEHL